MLPSLKLMMTATGAVGPKDSDEFALYTHMATVRHTPSSKMFIAFLESMDALMARQTDPAKYPEWLMKDAVKRTECRIHIYELLRKPEGKEDRTWIRPLDSGAGADKIFDSVAHFLLKKGVLREEMFGRA